MQVESFLEHSAAKFPQKSALVFNRKRFTYAELETKANRLACSLIAGGILRGDRVAIYLENSVEAVVSIFAILKAGAVFLILNPTAKPDKVSYILNNCRAAGSQWHSPSVTATRTRSIGFVASQWRSSRSTHEELAASGDASNTNHSDWSRASRIDDQRCGFAESVASSRNTRRARTRYHGFANRCIARCSEGANRPSAECE